MASELPERRIVVKPIVPVPDMAAAQAFYEQLGFEVSGYDDAYAWVTHHGSELLHLRHVGGLDPATNETVVYLHVQDVNAWHAAWTERGVDADAPIDLPWQMREFTLKDPGGNTLRIGQNL